MSQGAKFVGGTAQNGRLVLVRSDGSTTAELPDFILVRGVLTDNADSTFDLDFLTGS
jgi:hypothetical protein